MRQALMAGTAEASQLRHARTIARITRAIAGDSKDIANVLPGFPGQGGEAAAGPRAAAYPSPTLAVQHSILASRV
jgi:hypothetical protein